MITPSKFGGSYSAIWLTLKHSFFTTFNASKDYYQILGIGRHANADEIKKAFRDKAKQYHPDVDPKF